MGRSLGGFLGAAAVLVAVTASGAASPAGAAVRVITPEQMKPEFTGEGFEMQYAWISSNDTTLASFWAPVRLPVGATVTGMTYYHWGDGGGSTSVMLRRAKIEAPSGNPGQLLYATSSASVPTESQPAAVTTETPLHADSDMVVRRGYRYFVSATSDDQEQKIGGVKVFFRPPPAQ